MSLPTILPTAAAVPMSLPPDNNATGALMNWTYPTEAQSGVTVTVAANTLYVHPVYIPSRCIIDTIGFNVVTGVAASLTRTAIYSDLNGIPNTLMLDSGDISTASTGIKNVVLPATVLAGGIYWLGLNCNNATLRFTGSNAQRMIVFLGSLTSAFGSYIAGYNLNLTYGAMPPVFNYAGSTAVTTNMSYCYIAKTTSY